MLGWLQTYDLPSGVKVQHMPACYECIACRVSAVHHAAGHVLAMTRIALHHHGSGLEDRHGDLCHGQLLMVRLLCRNHWGVGCEHEVDS